MFGRNKLPTFGSDYARAQEISKRTWADSSAQRDTEISDIDMKYGPHVAGVPSHPQYKNYWNDRAAATSRMAERNRENMGAFNQTIGTIQNKYNPGSIERGEAHPADPADYDKSPLHNRNLNPDQFGSW
jgi:Sec-independent protein translocase protein TatA